LFSLDTGIGIYKSGKNITLGASDAGRIKVTFFREKSTSYGLGNMVIDNTHLASYTKKSKNLTYNK